MTESRIPLPGIFLLAILLLAILSVLWACSPADKAIDSGGSDSGSSDSSDPGDAGTSNVGAGAAGGVAGKAGETAVWFEDVTAESGLDFVHQAGIDGRYLMPEILGPGGALFDYDGDGDLDIYLIDGGATADLEDRSQASPNRLWRQDAGGKFVDVTARAGVGDTGFGMGCAVGDIDNDGDLDLYVSNYGADVLYRNLGDGSFRDVSQEAGIAGTGITGEHWSTSAGFFDADGDGWLDLFVTHYVAHSGGDDCRSVSGQREYCGPRSFPGVPDRLYRNLGDGRFADVSESAGISRLPGRGLGVLLADLNGDSRDDIYVANDGEKNQLWINLGDGSFEDRAVVSGAAVNLNGQAEASMGLALGDLDGDLDFDIFSTHLMDETNTLYLGMGQGSFADRVSISGLGSASLPFTGFGTSLVDIELDGDLDLLIANGKVRLPPGEAVGDDALTWVRDAYGETNLVFRNLGNARFEPACDVAAAFCDQHGLSRGLARGDLDGDGDLDLLLIEAAGRARLYRNVAPRQGHWLAVRAVDPELRRDAVGAMVEVHTDQAKFVQLVSRVSSYLTSVPAEAHFGLGAATTIVDIVVRWPSGDVEHFADARLDSRIEVRRGQGLQK